VGQVSPRLNEKAAAALGREYVKIREEQRARNQQRSATEGANPVPITVRQLEAIVRVSESLARMTLQTEVRRHTNSRLPLGGRG
jgi:DNA replication licensing factor MCM5